MTLFVELDAEIEAIKAGTAGWYFGGAPKGITQSEFDETCRIGVIAVLEDMKCPGACDLFVQIHHETGDVTLDFMYHESMFQTDLREAILRAARGHDDREAVEKAAQTLRAIADELLSNAG